MTDRAVGTNNERLLRLRLRRRVRRDFGDGAWQEVVAERSVPATAAAILLCDVWDDHWCRAAARRVDALAPVINQVVSTARVNGVRIIHAPSDTLAFYEEAPARRRALAVSRVELPPEVARADLPLPIDDSDGGCDSGEQPWYRAWTRQHPAIVIHDDDIISDDGTEIYSFLRQQGITMLLVAGVHTNMCVLNRSFGIKQMTRWGMPCALVRDLTDAMYSPARAPYVSHDAGTALVTQHIEQYWCPSVLSEDLTRAWPAPTGAAVADTATARRLPHGD